MVGFQVFVAMPVLMTALLLRGASTQKTGVDLPVTILMSLGIALQACGGWLNQAYLFQVLVLGAANLNAGAKASALVRRAKVIGVAANAFFVAVMFGTQIASVYAPVGVNSYRWGLVVRSVARCAALTLLRPGDAQLGHGAVLCRVGVLHEHSAQVVCGSVQEDVVGRNRAARAQGRRAAGNARQVQRALCRVVGPPRRARGAAARVPHSASHGVQLRWCVAPGTCAPR